MQLFESVSRWIQAIPAVRRARAGPRALVNEQAALHVPTRNETHPVLLRDLSVGGACIRTDLRLAQGDEVWLRVGSEPESKFNLHATIISVRLQSTGFFTDYGLRLASVNMEDAHALNAFILRKIGEQQTDLTR